MPAKVPQKLSFFGKFKLLFSDPKGFFGKVRSERFKEPFLMLTLTSLVMGTLNTLISLLIFFLMSAIGLMMLKPEMGTSPASIFAMALLGALWTIVFSFIGAGVIHLFVMMFKGTGSYVDTYKVFAYSFLPYYVIRVIPFVGWVSIIYTFFLMTFGLSEYHKLSTGKAVLAWLIPTLIYIVLIIVILFVFLAMAFGSATPLGLNALT